MEACVFSTLQKLLERVAQNFYEQLTVYCVQCSLFGVLLLKFMNKQMSLSKELSTFIVFNVRFILGNNSGINTHATCLNQLLTGKNIS